METALLTLRVTPKSSQDAVTGWHGDALKIKVRAAPENGRANEAVVEVLALALQLPRSAVRIESGHASRNKRVRVAGMSAAAIRRCLASAKS